MIAGAALCLILVGCGAATVPARIAATHLTPVTFMTDYLPGGTYSYLSYAIDHGFYRRAGLDVTLQYGGGSVLTAESVGSGKVDMGDSSSGAVALAVGDGTPIKAVGAWTGSYEFGFFVPKSSDITSAKDLRGKTVIVSPGSEDAELLPAVLRLAGVNPASVHVLALSAATSIGDYADGTGDAMANSVPYALPLVQPKRPTRIIAWTSLGFNVPNYSYIVSDSFLTLHAGVVRRFLKATYAALDAAFLHPKTAVEDLIKSNPTLPAGEMSEVWKLDKAYVCSPAMIRTGESVGFQNAADWSTGVRLFKRYATLPSDVTAGDIYTNRFFTGKDRVSTVSCRDFSK